MQKIIKLTYLKYALWALILILCIFSACSGTITLFDNQTASAIRTNAGLAVSIDKNTGTYKVNFEKPNWSFSGTVGQPLTDLIIEKGVDKIGSYRSIIFDYNDNCQKNAAIKIYEQIPAVLFIDTYLQAAEKPSNPFPNLTAFPKNPYYLSYQTTAFAVPKYSLEQNGSPWLFFDENADAFIISPADNFMVASIYGDGQNKIASGFNNELANLPEGYTHKTILVAAEGINNTWDIWGNALTDLHGKKRPPNDADVTLKYLGYWTDNGADYYYNYDKDKGYEGTLLALKEHLYNRGITIKYMQLDSWFYPKSTANPAGIYRETGSKIPPEKSTAPKWNNRGGMVEYVADKDVFPDGLAGFHKKLGLSLMTHNRWLDRNSPYHKKYKISGLGAIGPAYWNDIIAHIADSGVACYEQDWQNVIYQQSPQFISTTWAGNAFMDYMAQACKKNNITMQYCMSTPRFFMQGAKYDNLSTIRTAWDGFSFNRFSTHLYASRLAFALGIWPWVDVCDSSNTYNLIMMNLSAGIVGISDAIAKEHKNNIIKCVRNDGVIIKPDVPNLPVDSTYISDAKGMGKPVVSSTYTQHQNGKTFYVFAYSRRKGASFMPDTDKVLLSFTPSEFGAQGKLFIYNYFTQNGRVIDAEQHFKDCLLKGNDLCSYYIIAPLGSSNIALIGDKDKFVTCGKKRIREVVEENGKLTTTIVLAKGEESITLFGYAPQKVGCEAENCRLESINYDMQSNQFTITLVTRENTRWVKDGNETVAELVLTLELE